jgi:hypothetical protein
MELGMKPDTSPALNDFSWHQNEKRNDGDRIEVFKWGGHKNEKVTKQNETEQDRARQNRIEQNGTGQDKI